MYVFRKIVELREFLDSQKEFERAIGFVPTMGALHDGHLALVQESMDACDITVVSIYVNPTQFNESTDLHKYPRPTESDLAKLYEIGCQVVFLPLNTEVYPPGVVTYDIDFKGLDALMEGAFRPGHFKGVAQVMYRLLHIVQPDRLYMGQKDYQQTRIVNLLMEQAGLPVDLVLSPTIREADGLAMSSRNQLLTDEMRARAPVIHQALKEAAADIHVKPIMELQETGMQAIRTGGLNPEYFECADGKTFLPVSNPNEHSTIVICCAAWAGEVRLMDNIIAKQPHSLSL